MQLYILHIAHRHGDSYWAFDDEMAAKDRLAAWAREWWDKDGPDEPMPESDGDLICAYFHHCEPAEETYTIEVVKMNEG